MSSGFLRSEKIHRSQPGLNPRTLDLEYPIPPRPTHTYNTLSIIIIIIIIIIIVIIIMFHLLLLKAFFKISSYYFIGLGVSVADY